MISLEQRSTAIQPCQLPVVQVPALYVHIPFCFHKCHYCDFYSITRQDPGRMRRYVDLVLAEAGLWASGAGPVVRPSTIFFGGGTPTLLPVAEMQRLLAGLRVVFDLSAVDEWTVEANPATVTAEYCDLLKSAGVTRLSFGAQSFDRSELALLERHHNPDDVAISLALARQAGFTRLNLDLIYGIPGQTLESWSGSLEAAIALGTPHLSCYGLTYEPNTALAVRKRLGQFRAIEESLELQMMHHTRRRLAGVGMAAYEISNYAVAGEECRHNLVYWTGGDYIGLGPSAASHVQGWRWKNRPHLGEWESAAERGDLPSTDVEHLTPVRRAGELAMLLLRLERGVDFADFAGRTGLHAETVYADTLRQLASMGLIVVDDRRFRLTEKGLNVADAVAAEFLDPIVP